MLQTLFSSDTDLNVHLRQRQHHGTEAFQYRRADGGRDISVPFLGYPHKHLQGVRSMHAQREARATGGGGVRETGLRKTLIHREEKYLQRVYIPGIQYT